MCLITEMTKPETAPENITVYKVLQVDRNAAGEEILAGPFINGFFYTPGITYTMRRARFGERFDDFKLRDTYTCVTYGFHSYKFEEGAKKRAGLFAELDNDNRKYCVARCVIPKGARYFQGTFDFSLTEMCSEELIVKEILYYVQFGKD